MNTGTFQIIDGLSASGREIWRQAWLQSPEREVFAHPDYVRLFTGTAERTLCALYRDATGTIMFPLILRALRNEDWAAAGEAVHDLTTPYGYGGPLSWGRPDAAAFWTLFSQWAEESRIISLYTRLTLFEEDAIPFDGEVMPVSLNVVRLLDKPLEQIWAEYEHKVRKNINKARRSGLTVAVDTEGRNIERFLEIYNATMERRQAGENYYFPAAFFRSIIDNLPGSFAFFYCLQNDIAISCELVLVSNSRLYSFLGGTQAEYFPLRPNDLLKHEIISWGLAAGKKAFVLGGGQAQDDGIFRYKLSFAPQGTVPYCIGAKIFDQAAYDSVCALRRRHEGKSGKQWAPRPGFFPAYRW